MTLTQERLKELLHYDPETGVFRWKVDRPKGVKIGNKAGTLDQDGYRKISLDGKRFYAHRLVWLYVHGEFPFDQIDHKNRVPDDNRLVNLRQATSGENRANSKTTHLGMKGAYFHKRKRIRHRA